MDSFDIDFIISRIRIEQLGKIMNVVIDSVVLVDSISCSVLNNYIPAHCKDIYIFLSIIIKQLQIRQQKVIKEAKEMVLSSYVCY